MKIPVWSHASDPLVHRHDYRRSRHFCETEVAAGRARQLHPEDITQGVHLCASPQVVRLNRTEQRGSPSASGCVTAVESALSASYRGSTQDFWRLSREYEHALDKHVAEGKKGTPRACAVIAARVKTIMSRPGVGL